MVRVGHRFVGMAAFCPVRHLAMKRLLVILDLNGTLLCRINRELLIAHPQELIPDFVVDKKRYALAGSSSVCAHTGQRHICPRDCSNCFYRVFLRPGVHQFMDELFSIPGVSVGNTPIMARVATTSTSSV